MGSSALVCPLRFTFSLFLFLNQEGQLEMETYYEVCDCSSISTESVNGHDNLSSIMTVTVQLLCVDSVDEDRGYPDRSKSGPFTRRELVTKRYP